MLPVVGNVINEGKSNTRSITRPHSNAFTLGSQQDSQPDVEKTHLSGELFGYTLMSNPGNAAGWELGQSSIALECSLKPSSPGMFPLPKGQIRPMGTIPLPSSGVSTLGMQEHPCILQDQQTSHRQRRRWARFPFNACQVRWSCKYPEPDGSCGHGSRLQGCPINYRCKSWLRSAPRDSPIDLSPAGCCWDRHSPAYGGSGL